MSLSKMPTLVMEKFKRNFIMGMSKQKKKMHLMKWSSYKIKPKREGGLGFGSLKNKKRALLTK